MTKRYFTLVVREAGVWAPQFGDYDREVVEEEREVSLYSDSTLRRADCKIITSGDRQADIDAAIAKLNS